MGSLFTEPQPAPPGGARLLLRQPFFLRPSPKFLAKIRPGQAEQEICLLRRARTLLFRGLGGRREGCGGVQEIVDLPLNLPLVLVVARVQSPQMDAGQLVGGVGLLDLIEARRSAFSGARELLLRTASQVLLLRCQGTSSQASSHPGPCSSFRRQTLARLTFVSLSSSCVSPYNPFTSSWS